ncbi:MAG: transporter [Thermodesulfovibrionales bacterium]
MINQERLSYLNLRNTIKSQTLSLVYLHFISITAFLAVVVFFSPCSYVYAEGPEVAVPNPCAGPAALLALLDGPTVSDSACVVPFGHVILETDVQRAYLRAPGGTADNYPEAELRIGLPGNNEFVFLPPNYNRQRARYSPASSGLSAVTTGIKHEIGYTTKWLGAVEALFTLPSGGAAFGSQGLGAALNGILTYSLTAAIGLSLQVGVSSQTEPGLAGGRRFTSLTSNLVATWQPIPKLEFYDEIFGQTKTGPGEGAGYNMDGGIQYLITPSWEVDVEEGVRLIGNLGGFTHYHGFGLKFIF